MRLGVRTRSVVQSLMSAGLILGLGWMIWASSLGNRTHQDELSAARHPASQGVVPPEEDSREFTGERYRTILSLPAWREVEQLLKRLTEARAALLREAATGSAESAAEAVRDYQQVVHALQGSLERLRSRLTPDEYRWLLSQRLAASVDDADSAQQLPEQQLGLLQNKGQR